jgi:hypothetical protein
MHLSLTFDLSSPVEGRGEWIRSVANHFACLTEARCFARGERAEDLTLLPLYLADLAFELL